MIFNLEIVLMAVVVGWSLYKQGRYLERKTLGRLAGCLLGVVFFLAAKIVLAKVLQIH
jgi:putative effector of murein hydrolase